MKPNKTIKALLVVAGVMAASSASATLYTLTELPGSGVYKNSDATGINNSGVVVGYSGSSPYFPSEATLWNGTTPTSLNALSNSTLSSYATAINNAGVVVGVSGYHQTATVWNGVTPTDINQNYVSSYAFAEDINSAGLVVGGSVSSNIVSAIVWNGTSAVQLGTLGGALSDASAINDAGVVVGESQASSDLSGWAHATLWNGTTATDLGTLGGDYGIARDINTAGLVVGESQTESGNFNFHSTLWNGTTATDLGILAGATSSDASAINDSGVVVGGSFMAGSNEWRATKWDNGSLVDLNSLVNLSLTSWVLRFAEDINNSGQIVGYAVNNKSGQVSGFLLSPSEISSIIGFDEPQHVPSAVPLPAALPLMLSGLGVLGFASRRRKNTVV